MYMTVNDFKMFYEVSGNESGEWLVLVHGMFGSTRCWKYQINEFREHFKVLSIDLAGHGKSEGQETERYSGEIVANHIRIVMDDLGIKKAHFLGISLGTIIQQYFCELFPERVISTIYASPVTKSGRLSAFFNGFSDKVLLKLFSKDTYLKLMANIMMPGRIHEKSRKFFVQETEKMNDHEFFKWWKLVMEGNHYDYLRESNIPALIITGEKDFCFFSDSLLLTEKYNKCILKVIENAGHVTIFQRPEEFNRIVVEYLVEKNYLSEQDMYENVVTQKMEFSFRVA